MWSADLNFKSSVMSNKVYVTKEKCYEVIVEKVHDWDYSELLKIITQGTIVNSMLPI